MVFFEMKQLNDIYGPIGVAVDPHHSEQSGKDETFA